MQGPSSGGPIYAMNHSEYWNPRNERLSKEELRALQYTKLKRLCDWAYAKSAFHRRRWDAAKFHPDQLKSLDDLQRILERDRAAADRVAESVRRSARP